MDKQKEELFSWKNFEEFIDIANKNCNWLVLRNFEYLPNDFFGNDKDVDILCKDIDLFVKKMKLTKRSWGISAYQTVIEGKIVPFDVRFLGDDYYDKLWQYKMLKHKVFTVEGVPRLSDEDYFYSLIYHSKIQKNSVKKIYKQRLYDLSLVLDVKNYTLDSIDDEKYISYILSNYMKKEHYIYVKPIDSEVPENKLFINKLDKSIQDKLKFRVPKFILISKFIPDFLIKIIPKNVKNTLRGLLSE